MKKDYAEKTVKNGKIIDSEIKYPVHEFEIDKAYDLQLRNKIEAFRRETGTTKTLQLVMITTYGIRKNKYSNLVSGQVTLEDLFRPVF